MNVSKQGIGSLSSINVRECLSSHLSVRYLKCCKKPIELVTYYVVQKLIQDIADFCSLYFCLKIYLWNTCLTVLVQQFMH